MKSFSYTHTWWLWAFEKPTFYFSCVVQTHTKSCSFNIVLANEEKNASLDSTVCWNTNGYKKCSYVGTQASVNWRKQFFEVHIEIGDSFNCFSLVQNCINFPRQFFLTLFNNIFSDGSRDFFFTLYTCLCFLLVFISVVTLIIEFCKWNSTSNIYFLFIEQIDEQAFLLFA